MYVSRPYNNTPVGDTARQVITFSEIERDEAALIVFSLLAYAEQLEETVENTTETHEYEDKAFAYEKLAEINRMLFAIFGDHAPDTKAEIQRFLDIR